jgi:hypothetical protein
MRFTHRYIGSLLLAAALFAPVAILAAPGAKDDGVQIRVYDSHHKDYHNWDDREASAYRNWQQERNENREFSKLKREEQSEYWNHTALLYASDPCCFTILL